MSRWTIGIDDGFAMSRPTGIGRYTAAIMEALSSHSDASVRHVRHARLEPVRPRALRRALYLAWLASGVPGARLRGTVDLVHFTNYHVAPRKPGGLRYAATIHDLVPFRVPGTKSRAYAAYLRRSIAQALRVADVVFADSYAVRDEITEEFRVSRDAIRVVYVPATLTPLPAPEARTHLRRVFPELGDAPFALFVGALERRKNLVAFLEGLSRLPTALDGLRVVLAGRPGLGYGAIADAIARVETRRHQVHVLTDCSDEDLRAFYSVCEAFVFPSIYEGYGIPLLEAMQCGAPIVASDIPTSRELTSDAAVLVEPTADGIAEGLAALLESEDLRRTLVARGRTRVSEFTYAQTARQLMAGYCSVLASNR
jgi:glycosyltransferase involved in cell wall biosynthesis